MLSGYVSIFIGGRKQTRKEEGTHLAKRSPARVRKYFILCFHPYVVEIFMFTFTVLGAILTALVRKVLPEQ